MAGTVLLLQAWAPEGDPPDTLEPKAGNLLQVGQAASSAPAHSHTGPTEACPAQSVHGVLSGVIGDSQLPGDVKVPMVREDQSSWN